MTDPNWRKSSYTDNGECVELADLGGGVIGLRNSNRLEDGEVHLTRGQVAELVQRVQAGELDDLA